MVEDKEVGKPTPFVKKVVEEAKWRLKEERLLLAEIHTHLPEDLASLVTVIGGLGLGGIFVALGDELLKPKSRPLLDLVGSPVSKWLVELTGRQDWAGQLRESAPHAGEFFGKIPAVGEKIAGWGIIDRYPAVAETIVKVFGQASQLKEPVEEALKSATRIAGELPGFFQRMGEAGSPEQKALFFPGFVVFTAITVCGVLSHRKAAAICGERRERLHRRLIAHLKLKRPNKRISG